MPEKLTAAIIVQHFKDRYPAVIAKLEDYQIAKAAFLVEVGKECLELLRSVLEPFPDHIIVGRRRAMRKVMREIEEQLPTIPGIGAPQISRWIKWAGVAELLGDVTGLGQNQMHRLDSIIVPRTHSRTSSSLAFHGSFSRNTAVGSRSEERRVGKECRL